MKIKKFTARTFSEALELVKKELSQDAIILATEEKKGLRPHVEVTAAVDYEAADGRLRNEPHKGKALTTERQFDEDPGVVFTPQSYHSAIRNQQSAMAPDGAEGLRGEIAGLRSMLESMKNSGYEMGLPAKKREILAFLRERSIREEFALRLCDKTTDLTELPLLISSDIRIRRDQASRKAVMLIGPTGVGKTTTIAKLAAQAVKAGRKAAIINLDTWRIGAVEQTRIYARILGIPLATAANAAEFSGHLGRFAESRDVVFIDTTGRSPRDEAHLSDMAGLCKTTVPMELHLLMSAAADDQCMLEAHRAYRKLPIDYLGFTKVDEAVRFGALYNLILTYQKPVAWLTTGQRVPGDIEQATIKRLASLIMTGSSEFIVQGS